VDAKRRAVLEEYPPVKGVAPVCVTPSEDKNELSDNSLPPLLPPSLLPLQMMNVPSGPDELPTDLSVKRSEFGNSDTDGLVILPKKKRKRNDRISPRKITSVLNQLNANNI